MRRDNGNEARWKYGIRGPGALRRVWDHGNKILHTLTHLVPGLRNPDNLKLCCRPDAKLASSDQIKTNKK